MFKGIFEESILKRAQEKRLLKIKLINLRNFSRDKRKTVDDTPYGGGRGMILRADIVHIALNSIKPKPYSILLSASGKKFDQKKARSLKKIRSVALICGHYEGVDARVESFTDETLSVGDFVLTGGEVAAMAIVDATARLLPGVINRHSLTQESFSKKSSLEYPQFTKPKVFKNIKVPSVLLSGNHKEIEKWRENESKKRTSAFRPDLIKTKKD